MKRNSEVCASCKGKGYVKTEIDGQVDYDDCPFCDGEGMVDFDKLRNNHTEEFCEDYFEIGVG